jgi:hypothetical protein
MVVPRPEPAPEIFSLQCVLLPFIFRSAVFMGVFCIVHFLPRAGRFVRAGESVRYPL